MQNFTGLLSRPLLSDEIGVGLLKNSEEYKKLAGISCETVNNVEKIFTQKYLEANKLLS